MTKVKVRNVMLNILAVITVIAVAFVLFNIVAGSKGYAVTSNSMADRFVRGDAVFSRSVSFDSLKQGDIITVRVGNAGYFTHRIAEIDYEKRTVITKGDANAENDPMETGEKDIAGKMWYSVPYLGYFSILASRPSAVKFALVLAATAVVLMMVNIALKKKKTRGDNNE